MRTEPTVYRNDKPSKKTNPIYEKARLKHLEEYHTANFPFLKDEEDNIDTFALGVNYGIQLGIEQNAKIIATYEQMKESYEESIKALKKQISMIVEDRDKDIKEPEPNY